VLSIACSPQAARICAIAGQFDDVVLLSTDKSSEECDVDCLSYGAFVNSVAFSPDGNQLAGGGYANQVKVWDVSSLMEGGVGPFPELFTLRHDGPVNSVGFHPKSVMICSGGSDRKLCLWQAADGQKLHSVEMAGSVDAVTFSPCGLFMASGCSPNGDGGGISSRCTTSTRASSLLTSFRPRANGRR